jgi:hypothetical protein
MQADRVATNLKGMDDLDFTGWNNADWHGVFAHHHTDDVYVDWKVKNRLAGSSSTSRRWRRMSSQLGVRHPGSPPTRSGSETGSGRVWSESSRVEAVW